MPTPLHQRIIFLLVISLVCPALARAATEYKHGPDSERHEGVPQGKIEKFKFTSPKIFAGTERDCAVYIPAQYDGKEPACVMVFQDGMGYLGDKGAWRIPIVFDNLIDKKEMPVTVGIFVNPGVLPAPEDGQKHLPRFNRSYEYDTPSDQYVKFLMEEMLPHVEKQFNLNLTKDGNGRGICGSSSGGIAAFTAAWERPNEFRRVISTIGSFTSIHGGGNNYPAIIRKFEPKPIRVFLEDGESDLDNAAGSWYLANQEMAAALKWVGYEYQFVSREGGHSGSHGGPLMPDMLRFVWKDYPKSIETPANTVQPIEQILLPGEGWEVASEGHKFTEGPAVDKEGNVFFTDQWKVWKINASDGKVSVFVERAPGANGSMFGPDGRLYVVLNEYKKEKPGSIVAYSPDGKGEMIAEDVAGNDLCVNSSGGIYVTEPDRKKITYISPEKHEKKSWDVKNIGYANGITLTPDGGQLVVADTQTPNLWAFRVEADGSLSHEQPYFIAFVPAGQPGSGADGIRVDTQGRLYAATRMGVQVFDQAGKISGIMTKPQDKWLANLVFGGPKLDTLYVCCGDKVYKRKTKATGVNNWGTPILPEKPRL